MNKVRELVSKVGVFLAISGLLSVVAATFGYELRIFQPLEAVGPAAAWCVRLGLVLFGVGLFLLSPNAAGTLRSPLGRSPKELEEALLADRRFYQLAAFIAQRGHRNSFFPSRDPRTFQIVEARYCSEGGDVVAATDRRARYLVVYLKREAPPPRLQVTLDLQTGAAGEVTLDALQWSSLVAA